MSFEHPTILYVGEHEDSERLIRCAQQRDWLVLAPDDVLTALAMTITFLPDIAVLDTEADAVLFGETFMHLRPLTQPDGRLLPIMLLGTQDDWSEHATKNVRLLPLGTGGDALLDTVAAQLHDAQTQQEQTAYLLLSLSVM